MQINIKGEVNRYYVQTLCMIFYPGAGFSGNDAEDGTPCLNLELRATDHGYEATATAIRAERTLTETRSCDFNEIRSAERTKKIAVGAAVVAVLGAMESYKPSWGILTGVRPSKVATEYLNMGFSKAKVKKILTSEYLVIPKKAALATEVAVCEKKIIGTPDEKDCSVYISIPFCPSRCSYCSFVSYSSKRLLSLIPDYLERLICDVKANFALIRRLGLHVKSVYIGGGTPTILDEKQLYTLLETIGRETDVSALEEFTLEAGRPDTITAEKLRIAYEHGVTRISVNPQSLCEKVLERIGRHHTAEDFLRAYDIAAHSGIKYINTDLIVGLPEDNFKTFSSTFDQIVALDPANITVHTFCVKKSAELLRNGCDVFSMRGGDAGKCVDYVQIKAAQAGYMPYYMYRQKKTVGNFENVGFAKDGAEGIYNIHMMEETHSILAVGAGAVTKLVNHQAKSGHANANETAATEDGENTRRENKIIRLFNQKYPYEYLSENKSGEILAKIEAFYCRQGMMES